MWRLAREAMRMLTCRAGRHVRLRTLAGMRAVTGMGGVAGMRTLTGGIHGAGGGQRAGHGRHGRGETALSLHLTLVSRTW